MEIGNSGVQVMRHICYVILNCNNTRMREKIYSLIACLCVCDCVIFWLTHEFVCSFTFVRSLFVHSLLVRALIHRRRKSDVRRFVRVNINLFFSGQSLANCATSGNIINTINVTSINIIINNISQSFFRSEKKFAASNYISINNIPIFCINYYQRYVFHQHNDTN